MKQVTQRLRDGEIEVRDVPRPTVEPERVVVEIRSSLLSAGTERTKVQTARQSLLGKARSRPDQVKQVIDKARRDGVTDTVRAVRSRLDAPSGLGYSAAGVVLEVGPRVTDLAPGDRVACGGSDAAHAEIDHVPGNLCVPLPDTVDFDSGAFATLGSIALHGVRQADVSLGERVALIGLGLVGQLAGQLLRAAGCSVVGIDLNEDLVQHALKHGAADAAYKRDTLDLAELPREARDCDAVLITAATRSADPIELAAALSRDRGRVVIVGDVGLDVPRSPYYNKELDLRFSRSYGPGRYDREYEERGLDYPLGYVRWTERRNMRAFVELVAAGKVRVDNLVTERVPIDRAPDAYDRLTSESSSPLAILLQYGDRSNGKRHVAPMVTEPPPGPADPCSVGLIGAGSFAQRVLIPGLRAADFSLVSIASASGLSAQDVASRFEFRQAATPEEVIADPEVGLVVIATRHSSHAELASAALAAGKAVFVEKPPAIDLAQLTDLAEAWARSGLTLAVGFNRRYAPMAQALRRHVRIDATPVELIYRVNAGRLSADHWLNDLRQGGGRLVGEGCHFIDFACWLVGALPRRVSCFARPEAGQPLGATQSFHVTMEFADGSLATVAYDSAGADGLGKEYVEAHGGRGSALLHDFDTLELHEGRCSRRKRSVGGGKGHREEFVHLAAVLRGEAEPLVPSPLDTMRATFAALRSAHSGLAISPDELTPGG